MLAIAHSCPKHGETKHLNRSVIGVPDQVMIAHQQDFDKHSPKQEEVYHAVVTSHQCMKAQLCRGYVISEHVPHLGIKLLRSADSL